ncbi:MAG: IclR family transcriptional regulator [Mycobacterium sp.]
MSNVRSERVPAASGVQSVDRAVATLEILARDGEVGVTDVAAELGVHKSTAFRLLGALELGELVEQVADRGKYRLGFGILRLANAMPSRLDVTEQGRDVCEELAVQLGDTVNIAVLQSHYVINIVEARGPSAIGTHNWVGQPTPLHATSSGKALLAFTAAHTRRALLEAAGLQRFTANTLTSVDALEKQLAAVPGDGYVVSLGEFEEGLNAVAAPIRDHAGVVVAALSVSGPAYRLTVERTRDVAPAVVSAAAEIARRMGYQRP